MCEAGGIFPHAEFYLFRDSIEDGIYLFAFDNHGAKVQKKIGICKYFGKKTTDGTFYKRNSAHPTGCAEFQ